jgi:hypothetical protein
MDWWAECDFQLNPNQGIGDSSIQCDDSGVCSNGNFIASKAGEAYDSRAGIPKTTLIGHFNGHKERSLARSEEIVKGGQR